MHVVFIAVCFLELHNPNSVHGLASHELLWPWLLLPDGIRADPVLCFATFHLHFLDHVVCFGLRLSCLNVGFLNTHTLLESGIFLLDSCVLFLASVDSCVLFLLQECLSVHSQQASLVIVPMHTGILLIVFVTQGRPPADPTRQPRANSVITLRILAEQLKRHNPRGGGPNSDKRAIN